MTNTRGPFSFFNKKEHIQWQKKKSQKTKKVDYKHTICLTFYFIYFI